MSVNKINPDSVILQQLDGHWQKIALLILFKCKGRDRLKITHQEIEHCMQQFAPGAPVLLSHGHSDSIEFQVIDEETAQRLAAHDATMRGTA